MSQKRCRSDELEAILLQVCAEFGVTADQMRGKHRQRWLVAARREFCLRAWAAQSFSSPEIGCAINRDHRTVLHHCGLLNKELPAWIRSAA